MEIEERLKLSRYLLLIDDVNHRHALTILRILSHKLLRYINVLRVQGKSLNKINVLKMKLKTNIILYLYVTPVQH